MLEAFADTHSYSLQQTLYAMGAGCSTAGPEIAEVRLSLPNKHHFEVDMSPFGMANGGRGVLRRRPAVRADRGHGYPG